MTGSILYCLQKSWIIQTSVDFKYRLILFMSLSHAAAVDKLVMCRCLSVYWSFTKKWDLCDRSVISHVSPR